MPPTPVQVVVLGSIQHLQRVTCFGYACSSLIDSAGAPAKIPGLLGAFVMFDGRSQARAFPPTQQRRSPSRPGKAKPRRGMPVGLLWIAALFLTPYGTVDAIAAEVPDSDFAPPDLVGKQFTLDGISSEGIPEGITVIFRDGRQFDATEATRQGLTQTDSGSYTYQRMGPYTGTLTTSDDDRNRGACSTYLTFTSATRGTYIARCANGVGSTGNFQLTVEDPFCLSLWDGLPCATVANLPQVYLGPLAANTATTEVVISNSDPNPSACEVALLFHQGTTEAPPVLFNGQSVDQNLFQTAVSREGAEIITLTSPDAEELLTGAVYVYARSPCTADSLQVQGRYLLENQTDGTIDELFSIASQSPQDWLGDGDCRVLTGIFGNGRKVDLASVTTQPGGAAPTGTRLNFRTFDVNGNFIGNSSNLTISGAQQVSSPWEFNEPRIIEMCLEVPGTSNFQTAVTAIGSKTTGSKVQSSAEIFADAFRVGDVTAWPVNR